MSSFISLDFILVLVSVITFRDTKGFATET
jgi:hypothetical protein